MRVTARFRFDDGAIALAAFNALTKANPLPDGVVELSVHDEMRPISTYPGLHDPRWIRGPWYTGWRKRKASTYAERFAKMGIDSYMAEVTVLEIITEV